MPGAPLSAPGPDGDGFDHLDLGWLASRPGAKWSSTAQGVLASWVADMDFPAPWPARRALEELAATGDLGYAPAREAGLLEEKWAGRMEQRFGWSPPRGLVHQFTNVVQAAQVMIELGTSPGDGVLLFSPAYPPFVASVGAMGRALHLVPASPGPTGWTFATGDVGEAASRCRAVLLVNPQNPTGRMLGRRELEAVAQLAERYDLLVISDEVHAELALCAKEHVPFASLGPEAAARTVTLYSASKAFNLGGMCCALAHVGPASLREGLAALPSHLLGRSSTAAVATTLACWSPEGDQWLARCLERLRANNEQLAAWLAGAGASNGVAGYAPEATYLCWLDFRAAGGGGLSDDPAAWLAEHARVRLSPGQDFGPHGRGFARLNFATAPNVLAEILARTSAALAAR